MASAGFANDLNASHSDFSHHDEVTLCFDRVFFTNFYKFAFVSNTLGFQVCGILSLHCFG